MTFSIHIDDVELEITFLGDDDDPEIKPPILVGKKFSVTLSNWTNPLGTSWYVPKIVSAEGRDVDVALTIHAIGRSPQLSRTVNYSIYSSEING